MRKALFLLPFVLVLALFVFAFLYKDQLDLNALSDWRNISFAIAFLGGVLSIFSPCSIAVFPAFASYAFKEKKQIAKVTLVFFLGFSLAFVILGVLIAYLGKVSFVYFQNSSSDLIRIIGFLLVIFGLLSFFGRGFTFLSFGYRAKHDFLGTFLFGIIFAVGWSACSGPIIAGILSIAAGFNNYAYSALLLFFYSLGISVPLFFMAFAYDKFKLYDNPLIKGKQFGFSILGRDFIIHTTNAAAGLMLIGLGIVFIVFMGTTKLTSLDLFGRFIVLVFLLAFAYLIYRIAVERFVASSNIRHVLFFFLFLVALSLFLYINSNFVITTVGYAEFFDRIIIQNSAVFNVIGIVALASFVFMVYYMLKRENIK